MVAGTFHVPFARIAFKVAGTFHVPFARIAFKVAGTFHVPFAMKKSRVFGATALGACLLLCYGTRSVPATLRRFCTLLRHSERACYFALILYFATALGACLLLCGDSALCYGTRSVPATL
jgi:hypothetical protein